MPIDLTQLISDHKAATDIVNRFVSSCCPGNRVDMKHKMLLFRNNEFYTAGLDVPNVCAGFSSADELIEAARARLGPRYDAYRDSILISKKCSIGSYLTEFKKVLTTLKDNEIRDFVSSLFPMELWKCTEKEDAWDFFRPNVGCVSVGSCHFTGRPRDVWDKTGLYYNSWIMGVEDVTPYYITRAGAPVARFLVQNSTQHAFYLRHEVGLVIRPDVLGCFADVIGTHTCFMRDIVITPPTVRMKDKILVPVGPMDNISYHNLFYSAKLDKVISIGSMRSGPTNRKLPDDTDDYVFLDGQNNLSGVYTYGPLFVLVNPTTMMWKPAPYDYILRN